MSGKVGLLALLAFALAGQANAQSDRFLTCELLRDIHQQYSVDFVAERGDLLYVSPHFDARSSEYNLASYSEIVEHISRPFISFYGRPDLEWKNAIEALPISMTHDLWVGWDAGGTLNCPRLDHIEWLDRPEARRRFRAVDNEYIVRQNLPPDHPRHLSAQRTVHGGWVGTNLARLNYIEISRPAFDSSRRLALVLRGRRPEIYRRVDGHWALEASPGY